jgi:hypothetical protein
MKEADQIGLEPFVGCFLACDFGQSRNAVALQAAVARRALSGIVTCRAERQPSTESKVCLRKATTLASSSLLRNVDLGVFGPSAHRL